jgi:AbrB family looped-hinge helix DNA binding protein
MPTATINAKGQITVPKGVREHLGVGPGDALSLQISDKGDVVVMAATVDIRTLKGMLKPRSPKVSLEAMNRAVRRGATGR